MEETARINLVVGADVPDLLTALAGGERKRGEYITQLVRAVYAGEQQGRAGADFEQMRLAFTGLASKQMVHEQRLLALEGQVAALMAAEAGHK